MSNEQRKHIECKFCGSVFVSQLPVGATVVNNWEACPTCAHFIQIPDGVVTIDANQPQLRQPDGIHYPAIHSYSYDAINLLQGIRTRELNLPVSDFLTNVSRLQTSLLLPGVEAWLIRLFYDVASRANLEVTGSAESPSDPEIKSRCAARAGELWRQWHQGPDEAAKNQYAQDSANNLGGIVGIAPGMRLGLESILVGQITGMWTAVEVLAAGLWEGAINAHPQGLAELKGKGKKRMGQKPQGMSQELGAESLTGNLADDEALRFAVSRKMMQRYNFDLKARWGTVLIPEDGFSGLAHIRKGYVEAFYDDYVSVDAALGDSCFDKLASVRNAIVHRGGFADKKFTEDVGSFSEFSSIKLGQRIPITGPAVTALVQPVIDNSIALIKAVDSWVVCHPVRG